MSILNTDKTTFITELVLCLNRKTIDPVTKSYDKFLVFSLSLLQLTAVQKTFTLEATVRLGAVHLQHYRTGQKILDMIQTLDVKNQSAIKETGTVTPEKMESVLLLETAGEQYLFTVTYSNVSILGEHNLVFTIYKFLSPVPEPRIPSK